MNNSQGKIAEEQLIGWLTLYFVPRLGPKKFTQLLKVDSPFNLIHYSVEQLQQLKLSAAQIQVIRAGISNRVSACLEWQQQSQHHIITLDDPNYPRLLKETVDAPPLLFIKGRLEILNDPQIAIVGSRNASLDGLKSATNFSKQFVANGLVVTSGLALGIDGYAHNGALQAGGDTVAVLGSGLDVIYPARHKKLAAKIIEKGALISEFSPTMPPKAGHFPRRNRIISGLSSGVVVIEAAEKSGSLITARFATEQNREVFVVPASINNLNAKGGNALIRSGAMLVENAQQVIDEINTLLSWSLIKQQSKQAELFEPMAEESKQPLPFPQLLANLGVTPVAVDLLSQRTNIPINEVMTQLLELELQGLVTAVPGGYIRV